MDIAIKHKNNANLSRRQIAAISFLSNIPVEGEDEDDLPGFKCLQGTEVLESYRRQARCRRKLPAKRGVKRKEVTSSGAAVRSSSRERTPESGDTIKKLSNGSFRRRTNEVTSKSRNLDTTVIGRSRKQLLSEDASKTCGSQESVHGHGDMRQRQISGTLSDHSHSSNREVVYIKSDVGDAKLVEERMVFISHGKVPFSVSSTIPYNKYNKVSRKYSVSRLSLRGDRHGHHELTRRHRHQSGMALPAISDSFDAFELLGLDRTEAAQEISYSNLLEPSYSNSNSYLPLDTEPSDTQTGPVSPRQIQLPGLSQNHDENGGGGAWGVAVGTPYSPHMVDGWLVAGKHSRLIPFHGYITSIIEYVKPSEMKKELNEQFASKFPGAQITLSKLRSIKFEMRKIGLECQVDTVTIAQAYVYFEKLVLKNIINKRNRKFSAGASLILAAKLNDCKGDQLKLLIDKTEQIFRLERKDLLASEFAILVALEFSLHIPSQEIYPHYQRLLYQT